MLDLYALAERCAPAVDPITVAAIVRVESAGNPYAIGVVGGRLARQPRSLAEALATANKLQADGWRFSVGLAQIYIKNVERFGLTVEQAFDPCTNLKKMSTVLHDCWSRSSRENRGGTWAMRAAISCYHSNSFHVGESLGYVDRVVYAAQSVRRGAP